MEPGPGVSWVDSIHSVMFGQLYEVICGTVLST